MTSSLFGIFNSHRSLLLNQAALNLINSNIANINTPGYSKQRLELSQNIISSSDSSIPMNAAQSGGGAIIDSISRNRDAYLDTYYRRESTSLNFYKELNETATLIEDISNELGETGISGAFNEFYNAAHQLSINPTDSIIRNDFIQKAMDLCNRFNLTYDRLDQLRDNLVGDITNPSTLDTSKVALTVDDLNTQLAALADLNKTISTSTAQGTTPNGLLDERDRLLDRISEYIPINVTQGANNLVTVSLGSTNLVTGREQVGFFDVVAGDINNPATVKIVDSTAVDIVANANSLITSGKLGGILQMGGSNANELNIYNTLSSLNTLAQEFATQVNTIHQGGQYIDTSVTPNTLALVSAVPFDIFVESNAVTNATYANMTAGNITLNQDVINDAFKVAAASATSAANETGDGGNALVLAQLRNTKIATLGSSDTESFLNSVIGKLGIQIKSIQDSYTSQGTIVQQINSRREATIGVNLDEELTDLIRFQRAFEASAKVLNVMDKALEQIIGLAR
ncbi:MAG: flagellar hook-associated protein FlgK [uncultured bacterium]|nr:MAG: flagellar hook-associated protein FlgK [uncultured bacterium]HBH17821.1 flagellar hook-associated protein FlgK [Cyanobacteria bacterium UBA9579]